MYSREEKLRAVKLYIQYDKDATDVMRELGYPCFKTLCKWYAQYVEELKSGKTWEPKLKKYTLEEKERAVDYYLKHGHSLKRTMRNIGYPCQENLARWIDELRPGTRKIRRVSVPLSYDQQKDAVNDLSMRNSGAQAIADRHGVSRCHLYVLKRRLSKETKEQELDPRGNTYTPTGLP